MTRVPKPGPAARKHPFAAAVTAGQVALDSIEGRWGLWADEVRQGAEQRLGLGAGEDGADEDTAFAAALDIAEHIENAQHHLGRIAALLRQATGEQP